MILAISIAVATFIENDFGSETARAHIYNATWFELLFLLACINLVGSMLMHKVYRKGKLSILLFHLSFLLILIGAGITRYFGFTGLMHIREGEKSSIILSDESFLSVNLLDGDDTDSRFLPLYLSELRKPGRLMKLGTGSSSKKIRLDYLDHISNARPMLQSVPQGKPGIILVASSGAGKEYHVLYDQDKKWIGREIFYFNQFEPDPDKEISGGIHIKSSGDTVWFTAPYPVNKMNMGDQSHTLLEAGKSHTLEPMVVYSFAALSIVLAEKEKSAEVMAVKLKDGEENGRTAVSLRLSAGNSTKDITVWGGKGMLGEPRQLRFENIDLMISVGSIPRSLPFSLELQDFILERYPGSESPSSFESVVYLRDEIKGTEGSRRIYMNHILNYRGYRFYQSSYDVDEMGTVLSVNRDGTGTFVSYAGYLLLAIGIILSLINPNSRFRSLSRQLTLPGKAKSAGLLSVSPAPSDFFAKHSRQ